MYCGYLAGYPRTSSSEQEAWVAGWLGIIILYITGKTGSCSPKLLYQ